MNNYTINVGDDLYPKTPDLDIYAKPTDRKFDSTVEELNNSSVNFHRENIRKKGSLEFKLNVSRYGQV
jgi:hypothetical protein